MGSWHLIAHCRLRDRLRDFALSRIKAILPTGETFEPADSNRSIKDYIRLNFGLLAGKTQMRVCLKFSPAVRPWVTEQVWHADQQQKLQADGSLCLTFPVADLREVKREILKFGSEVEVLSPAALRREIKSEIGKMKNIYP